MIRDTLYFVCVWGLSILVIGTLYRVSSQYRIHLYAVPVCAPPVSVDPHALSINPFAETP